MREVATPEELIRCFREIDRADVELPLTTLPFPLCFADVLAWSAGPRAFLLYRDSGRARGIVFHRGSGAVPEAAAMCEWCHTVRSHGGVRLLSVAVDRRRRVGLYLCADLSCLERARELPGPDDLREGLDVKERSRRIVARIARFARRSDLS